MTAPTKVYQVRVDPDRLGELMAQKCLGPRDLAVLSDVHFVTIYKALHGVGVRRSTIRKLAAGLGVEFSEITLIESE